MRKSRRNRQFAAALGWGVMLGTLWAPMNGSAADPQASCPKTQKAESVASVGESIQATQVSAFLGDEATCGDDGVKSILARIPYMSRLFVNVPLEDNCGDDAVERIGVDFDFALEGPQTSRGIRVVADVATPTCPAASPARATNACPITPDVCPNECLLVEQLLQKELESLDCDTDGIGVLAENREEGSIRERLAAVSAQATILTHLSEMQTELVEARMEMAEKLVETRMEFVEQLTQLTIENERLKAKLEFQKEREEFQAKIAELTAQNQTARLQAAAEVKLHEASHQLQQTAQAYAQLLQSHQLSLHRIAELEGKLKPQQPAERREEVAERTDRVTPTRSQY